MLQTRWSSLASTLLRLSLLLGIQVVLPVLGVLVSAEKTEESKPESVTDDLEQYLPFKFSQILSLHWWLQHLAAAYREDPEHTVIEFVCVMIIFYLLFRPTTSPPEALTEKEKDVLIDEWVPESLVPETAVVRPRTAPKLTGATSSIVTVEGGKRLLNFASYNYLGLANDPRLKKIAKDTITKYSVGSCGPRGFYGTIDVHIDLENKLREHFKTEGSIIYTDWIGCINSVIPAFAKKHDLLVCDEGIHFLIQQGIRLSRANVLYFKHNDMDDLRQVLESLQEKDQQMSNKKLNRRFIMTEGISQSFGDICPLKELVGLALEFKYRIILDDSHAVGVVHPRGSVGYHGVSIENVDIIVGSLDTAVGSTGAFVVGNEEICYHQSLSSTGYVFTASAPPFQCTCAVAALDIISNEPNRLRKLQENSKHMRQLLAQIKGISVDSHDGKHNDDLWNDSPLIHMRLSSYKDDVASELLERIQQALQRPQNSSASTDTLMSAGVFICVQQFLESLARRPQPSLKVCVSAEHTSEQIKYAAQMIKATVTQVLNSATSLRSSQSAPDLKNLNAKWAVR